MTSYIAISSGEIDADSPVTADLMSKLSNNPIAISEGASGAPKVKAAALNTTTNSVSGTLTAGSGTSVLIGAYAFFPSCSGSNAAFSFSGLGSTADDGRLGVSNPTGSSISYTVMWRSIL